MEDYKLNARRLTIHDEPAAMNLTIEEQSGKINIQPELRWKGNLFPIDANLIMLSKKPLWILVNDNVIRVEGVTGLQLIAFRKTPLPIIIPSNDREQFLKQGILLLSNNFNVESSSDIIQVIDVDKEFEAMRDRMRSFTNIASVQVPEQFIGKLRPYQKGGYDWLNFLREFRFGGILADDMGLGKTVQTLALLQQIYQDGPAPPTLIIVPTSLVFNWIIEAQRFTPNLRVQCHRGLDRKKNKESFNGAQVIITSYGILRRDILFLKDIDFLYAILDESQNIKNANSVNAKAARLLKAQHRLALTGTPVENNLLELWSQFAFLNPGMLGTAEAFAQNFASPIERNGDESAASALKRILYPFILRRSKELVEKDLPLKQESIVYCEMDEAGFQKSKFLVLQGLMKLRQVCCHPSLVDLKYDGSSGKFDAFIEMLDDILAEGHKVLVFSQYVKMLTILRTHFDERSILYEYLDGRTKDRQSRVEHFQSNNDVKLFLISLKAGGTGLNLTAADYVIHYDPWWNPAVEMQATDRAHRIGQTKHVFSYKLITKDTVEEKVLALQEKKRQLVKSIITTDGSFMKKLKREDVEALFG